MRGRDKNESKFLDVDASMHGSLSFNDPVNLRINGSFEGRLDTKGTLTIGENATVRADIVGEQIIIGGRITGNVIAQKEIRLMGKAHIVGDITTPVLVVETGAVLHGKCQMLGSSIHKGSIFNAEELARYLEVDVANITNWANSGKIPAFKENNESFLRQI